MQVTEISTLWRTRFVRENIIFLFRRIGGVLKTKKKTTKKAQ